VFWHKETLRMVQIPVLVNLNTQTLITWIGTALVTKNGIVLMICFKDRILSRERRKEKQRLGIILSLYIDMIKNTKH